MRRSGVAHAMLRMPSSRAGTLLVPASTARWCHTCATCSSCVVACVCCLSAAGSVAACGHRCSLCFCCGAWPEGAAEAASTWRPNPSSRSRGGARLRLSIGTRNMYRCYDAWSQVRRLVCCTPSAAAVVMPKGGGVPVAAALVWTPMSSPTLLAALEATLSCVAMRRAGQCRLAFVTGTRSLARWRALRANSTLRRVWQARLASRRSSRRHATCLPQTSTCGRLRTCLARARTCVSTQWSYEARSLVWRSIGRGSLRLIFRCTSMSACGGQRRRCAGAAVLGHAGGGASSTSLAGQQRGRAVRATSLRCKAIGLGAARLRSALRRWALTWGTWRMIDWHSRCLPRTASWYSARCACGGRTGALGRLSSRMMTC